MYVYYKENSHYGRKLSFVTENFRRITGGIKLQEVIYLISPLSVMYSLLSINVSSHLLTTLLPFNNN